MHQAAILECRIGSCSARTTGGAHAITHISGVSRNCLTCSSNSVETAGPTRISWPQLGLPRLLMKRLISPRVQILLRYARLVNGNFALAI